MEVDNDSTAVAGWNQRRGRKAQAQMQHAKKQHYRMARGTQTSDHVDLNYSKDDSSDDDVYGVDFNEQEEKILETIAG